jgi:exosortase/archaeosortase family protein
VNTANSKITTPLLWRVVIFLGLFVLISGLIGPRVISGGVLFHDGFAVYGGLGKATIFGLIALALLIRHKGLAQGLAPWRPVLLTWLIAAFGLFVTAWVSVTGLLAGERTMQNLLLAHAGLILSVVCAAVACIGPDNTRLLWRTYKRELLLATITAALFYVFLTSVYMLWQPLASIVLVGVHALLKLTSVSTVLIPPNTLVTDKFGITVAQFCSGIESIALFTGLYVIVGLLDRQRLNIRHYVLVFPLALIVLFGLNILRVFGLIAAGYYINPKIAFSLFHTYAGMAFFILYSAVFWLVAYKYLIKDEPYSYGHLRNT